MDQLARYRIQSEPATILSTANDNDWLLIHHPPRQDGRIVSALRQLECPFVAFYETTTKLQPGRRAKHREQQLIPGYIFAQPSPSDSCDRHTLFEHLRPIVGIHEIPSGSGFIDELRSFCQVLEHDPQAELARPDLIPGKHIRVTAGALEGCSGYITERQGRWRLQVNLSVLGTSVSSWLDPAVLELSD